MIWVIIFISYQMNFIIEECINNLVNGLKKIKNMKTKREIGQQLESWVLSKIKEFDPTARLSRASGASNDLGDVSSQNLYVECKKRNTETISIKESVWNHLLTQLPINTKKLSIMVLENKNNKRFVVLDADEFFRIYQKGLK